MAADIDVDTLRDWLAEERPVTVLDVRTKDDRAEWWIPGSIHVDAYDALQKGQIGPLADIALPAGQPIVTVCGAGRTSHTAAELLAARGLNAHSLAGGMKAWSLAWNAASVPLATSAVEVIQIRRTGKGCLSYLIAADGDAAVVDPSLPVDIYLAEAKRRGWRIGAVLETHVHADHLSRARDLADCAGASLLIPAQTRVRFPFTAVADGDRIAIGKTSIVARHTPGHTDESTSYVLNGEAVFTGDTLFINGVGRPDLHGGAGRARMHAQTLFHSLVLLSALPPRMLVLPAHTNQPVPFDRRAVSARVSDLRPWLADWLTSEPEFVERVLQHLPPTPPNFAQIVTLNESGALQEDDAMNLEAGANRCSVS
jgi:glyoxylase-like metal-dependent hydrolase (beta-lactamase superfamily II)/rhodanese-related sulfurtransferase